MWSHPTQAMALKEPEEGNALAVLEVAAKNMASLDRAAKLDADMAAFKDKRRGV